MVLYRATCKDCDEFDAEFEKYEQRDLMADQHEHEFGHEVEREPESPDHDIVTDGGRAQDNVGTTRPVQEEVLDATCGGRAIWHPENKDREDTLYVDTRQEPGGFIDADYDMNRNPGYSVDPDDRQDFRDLPYDDEEFNLAVFDPPHAIREGGMKQLSGITHKKWGCLAAETWQSDLRQGFEEIWRVLKPGGTLILKFADESADFEEVLDLAPEPPLFGTSVNDSHVETRWYVFHKSEADSLSDST